MAFLLATHERIPRLFHFVFGLKKQVEPFHLIHYLCLASCIETNRLDAVIFHYEHEPWGPYWDLIKPRLELRRIDADIDVSPPVKSRVEQRYSYAHRADFIRLKAVLAYGGVYADIDTLFLRPYPESFFSQPFVMGRERVDWTQPASECGGSLCNAVFLSEKQSEFGALWLSEMHGQFDGSWSRHSTFLPYRLSLEHPQLIHVEPESSFFKLDWSREGIRDLFSRRRRDLDDAYSLHLWEHLWWRADRVDFTRFHAGCITPAYVACSSSTFAGLTRKYLPKTGRSSRLRYCAEATAAWPAPTARRAGQRAQRLFRRLAPGAL